MDWLFGLDMQKDWILPSINSVKLNPTGANVPVHVDIQSVVINGEKWNLGGYLDIGICGYDEGSDGEFYRSGGVLDHRNSISEAPRRENFCGITDPAGKRREGAEEI